MATSANFKEHELKCPCCGVNEMDAGFLETLERCRARLGIVYNRDMPLIVTSAYRCPEYNKKVGGSQRHETGQAIDIGINGRPAANLLRIAFEEGMTGIGIRAHGKRSERFMHMDTLGDWSGGLELWTYPIKGKG